MSKDRTSDRDQCILSGSEKIAPRATRADSLNPNEKIDITVRIRRKQSVDSALQAHLSLSHEEYERRFGASTEDLSAVEGFAHDHHLSVVTSDSARRSVVLKGKVKDFEKAFEVHLSHYRYETGDLYRCRTGSIRIPRELEGIIVGVFGLDNRPQARPMFQVAKHEGMFLSHAVAPRAFSPIDLAKIYGFPKNVNGQGQCIGIIELGGGYRTGDLHDYFAGLGLPVPGVKAVSVDGGINDPSTPDSADGEVMLDIEVAGGVAPGAKIVVYFAPNTDKGFLDAITTAVHDTTNKPSALSISWGAAEKNWTTQSLRNFNDAFQAASLLGITVSAAAGDQGSSDRENDGKVHADFPASSPFVLACGGTKLVVKGGKISSETVWHESDDSATGGGISDFFPLPDYQKKTKIPVALSTGFKGRGFPDVAGNADPNTGYKVLVDGEQLIIGGTSAVAPLMAGLIALINQQNGKKAGFIHPILYSSPKLCRDIIRGDNITTATRKGYKAGAGWDPCTGWGVLSKL